MSSISDAIPNKPFPKARYSSAFCLGFLFKDFCYHPTQVLLLSLQDVGVYIASSPQGVTLG